MTRRPMKEAFMTIYHRKTSGDDDETGALKIEDE